MIKQNLANSSKGKALSYQSSPLKYSIENLSIKLKRMKNLRPYLDSSSHNLSLHSGSNQKQLNGSEANELEEMRSRIQGKKQSKINWNNSAGIMSRDRSPEHSIPKAKRFNQTKRQGFPELSYNLRTKLDKAGASFAKATRKQLFKPNLITPSPQQYSMKRFLEQDTNDLSTATESSVWRDAYDKIKGGVIPKFSRYQNMYQAHTRKLNYNERIIKQAQQRKSKSLPHWMLAQSI